MSEYILILVLMRYSGAAATSVEFSTKQACQAARELVLADLKESMFVPRAFCVPK